MRPFDYRRADDIAHAVQGVATRSRHSPAVVTASVQYLAGGTTLLDLMKLDVMRPTEIMDIRSLKRGYDHIVADETGLHLGALAHMADVADHPDVKDHYPVIAQSLMLAASAQLRNMATLGGNVLQRTRCEYFRDTHWAQCNKRNPGSGCAAMEGRNRQLAVLGTSQSCIATYPGDLAAALMALDATVHIQHSSGRSSVPFARLHRLPGDTPHIETVLEPGDLITGFSIPAAPWTRRSLYLKIRDRDSYQFALASAAVALDLHDGVVRSARIALGGVATTPWRAGQAEEFRSGKRLDPAIAESASTLAFAGARGHGDNDFKTKLGPLTVARALIAASALEV